MFRATKAESAASQHSRRESAFQWARADSRFLGSLGMTIRSGRILFLLLVSVLCSGCPSNRAEIVVIGSKNFTESMVLGELMAQQIETHTALRVDRRFYLAGTYICHQAIVSGRIDVYPEYTGTALTAILKEKPDADSSKVYVTMKNEYENRFHLTVGPAFGFNDTFAMEIRGEDARRLKLKTLSQAVPYAPQWRAGFGYEFMERPDGYRGLVVTYGLHFKSEPRIMDLGLLARALKDHQIDIAAGNATDGLIPAMDLFVLEDDRHYFPPYEAVPVIRDETLRQHPEVGTALALLQGKISNEKMQHLNYAVDGQRRDVKDVVHEFLKKEGLLPGTRPESSSDQK